MGPINIRCEKYINDSYITKQSDLHYVKKSADKLRQINKKVDFALKTFFMKDPFNYMGFTVNSIFCRFVRVEQ